MDTEKETITQIVSEILFILGAFNLIFVLEKRKNRQEEKQEERIEGCIFWTLCDAVKIAFTSMLMVFTSQHICLLKSKKENLMNEGWEEREKTGPFF